MTIYLNSGRPGSGKSLDAARDIRFTLNRRTPRPVLGNFELSPTAPVRSRDYFHYFPNKDLYPQLLMDWADEFWTSPGAPEFSEDYLLLVLDECQILWNARSCMDKGSGTKKDSRMDWLEFFSQHRKWGFKVLLIAQSDKMIDNQFRMLIDYEVRHRKLSKFGLWGYLIGSLFFGRLFLRIVTYYETGERLESELFLARKKDFEMYDSYKKFER